ncbi:hypothetical protein GCM10020000_12800 [Streptomyces olivoverticillatus]
MCSQGGDIGPATRHGDQVRNEPLIAFAGFADGDHGVTHIGKLGQSRLDFAKFDAVTTYLHLVVDPAYELYRVTGRLPYQIAGAIQT